MDRRQAILAGVFECLLVNLFVPKVMSNELGFHCFEGELGVRDLPLVHPRPIDERDAASSASSGHVFAHHFGRGPVAMQSLVALRLRALYFQRGELLWKGVCHAVTSLSSRARVSRSLSTRASL